MSKSAIWERELEINDSWNPVKYEGETDEGGEGVEMWESERETELPTIRRYPETLAGEEREGTFSANRHCFPVWSEAIAEVGGSREPAAQRILRVNRDAEKQKTECEQTRNLKEN
jgi:hypothetical protein